MKKTLILLFLLSFSFSQNMGILKTKKNKSGLGIFITSYFMYKSDSEGHNIRNIPERFRISINYSAENNFDSYLSSGYGEVELSNGVIEDFYNTSLGIRYHFYKKKWGASIDISKTKWFTSNDLLNNDNEGIGFTLYSKTKYHPYFSFNNYFFNDDNSNQESITFGGLRQINRYIMHWGWSIILDYDNLEIRKDNASFFIGAGVEFF